MSLTHLRSLQNIVASHRTKASTKLISPNRTQRAFSALESVNEYFEATILFEKTLHVYIRLFNEDTRFTEAYAIHNFLEANQILPAYLRLLIAKLRRCAIKSLQFDCDSIIGILQWQRRLNMLHVDFMQYKFNVWHEITDEYETS